jgi:hypothetical protein
MRKVLLAQDSFEEKYSKKSEGLQAIIDFYGADAHQLYDQMQEMKAQKKRGLNSVGLNLKAKYKSILHNSKRNLFAEDWKS